MKADDARLFSRYAATRDPSTREQIFHRFKPLSCRLAQRFNGSGELDDLYQVAALGLLKAIDRFDVDRGYSFSTYAVPTILGELKRHCRDAGWPVHVSRALQTTSMRARKARDELTGAIGHTPTVDEIAAAIGEPREAVVDALACETARHPASLDVAVPRGDEDGITWYERIGDEDDGYDAVEWNTVLDQGPVERVIAALPERDRRILECRFKLDMKQAEIAEVVGLSQMYISRRIKRILAKLRIAAEAAA